MSGEIEKMEVKQAGDRLTIEVTLSKESRPSKTGKSTLLYTSRGYQWFNDLGLGISLNIIKSKKA